MILLLIIWIVGGIFNVIFYLYQCVKDGEILVQDIFFLLIMLFVGLIGTVAIVCSFTFNQSSVIIWKRKD